MHTPDRTQSHLAVTCAIKRDNLQFYFPGGGDSFHRLVVFEFCASPVCINLLSSFMELAPFPNWMRLSVPPHPPPPTPTPNWQRLCAFFWFGGSVVMCFLTLYDAVKPEPIVSVNVRAQKLCEEETNIQRSPSLIIRTVSVCAPKASLKRHP